MQLQHQKITLDVNDTRAFTVLNAHQGDSKTRFIDITLTESGNAITLSSSYVATVKASINNKTKAVNTAVVDATNNIITVELTKVMLDTPGLLNCEVILQDNQQFVTSATFTVKVAESVISDETEIVASQEFGKLLDALIEIKDIEDKADRVQALVDNIDKLESADEIVTRLSNVESKETQLETQHRTDVQGLTDKANNIIDQANTDRQNFNNSVDEINTTLETKENVSNKVSEITHPSLDYYPDTKAVFDYVNSKISTPLADIETLKSDKLDKTDFNSYKTSNDNAVNSKVDTTDFNTYKTATDKAVKDNADNIKLLDTNKANLVQSKNLFDMTSYLNFLNALATRPIINGTLDNIDSSSFTFTTTGNDCYTNGWAASSGTIFKIQVQQNTTYTMSWNFSGSDGSTFVFFNGVTGSGNMVQTKNSNMKLTFTTKEDTTFITVRFGIDDGGTSATIGKIQVEEGTESTTYLPSMVSEGVNEVDKAVNSKVDTTDFNSYKTSNDNAVDEINTKLETKENISNKIDTIDSPSTTYYPSSMAVWDYVTSKLSTPLADIETLKNNIANLEAYIGSITDVAGLCVDYENKTFTRLAGAVGLSAGSDFDKWKMYGGRKRCNVADDGTILAYYGDANYKEDGSNGQVMVYQPKFYYLIVPINYDVQETGVGYHLRKANYYVSEKARTGFRLHPAFYDVNGNEVDYILMGAYEGSIYDTSASAYLLLDEQVMTVGEDKLSSIAGVKPASGLTQNLTRPNIETMAQNRGANWHLENSKIASMNQLLCMIEMGTMNFQSAIGQGVVSAGGRNGASNTGATSSLGNRTGQATQTTHISSDGTETIETTPGKLSVSYRGLENPWGNIWKFIIDPNIWGNGAMGGGEPFYCDDFNFAENKRTDNYKGAGFTVTNDSYGFISAMGYSTACDWLFMASETAGNSSLPVGDYTNVTPNLNGYRIARLGGHWLYNDYAGGFCWFLIDGVGSHYQDIGGRLVYVPTATV